MIAYDPVKYTHLWDYITVDSVTYTNQPDLVDWDSDVEEWNPVFMGQWPFSNSFPELELLDCLDRLDSDLDFEEWVMDEEEAALDNADDDHDDDNDDDDNDKREDEGYITDEKSYSEHPC